MAPVGLAGSSFPPRPCPKEQLYAEDLPHWVNGIDPPLVQGLFRNPFWLPFGSSLASYGTYRKKVRHLP